jgi:hypothetical protein
MSDGSFDYTRDGLGSVTTWVYDAGGQVLSIETKLPPASALHSEGGAPDLDELERRVAAAKKQRQPILTHTFEFRLSGSETHEQWLPLSEGSFRLAQSVVAMRSVQASLTRDGNAAASATNGVEVHAELRPAGIFCTAKLSDFGEGDLVVVRVEVGLY